MVCTATSVNERRKADTRTGRFLALLNISGRSQAGVVIHSRHLFFTPSFRSAGDLQSIAFLRS
ncbi:hypothetical protein C8R44DRAFT_788093 [Mycena epipterygia]|nr:hypothetical protein C8R44DRAFT_788093 [Mycena epipterygia]